MAGVWTGIVLLTIVQWTRAAPAGYEGCYPDSFIRVLPHDEKWDFQLTNARCVSHCRNKGYAYAGTEWALQCFCGTEQNFQNLPAALSDSECNSDCSGNNAEKCGGSLKLSVYAVGALEDEIRLVGGSNDREGRVEVRAADTKDWGTVCDGGFDMDDAAAACRMLGHGDAEEVRDSTSFGQGSGAIKMANLGCGGHESSLFDCSYDGPGSHSCSHSDDVGIVCNEKPASGLGLGAIIGIVVGVIVFLTVMFTIICVLACQSKPSSRVTATGVSTGGNTVVHTNHMGANTVVHTNMMYPGNGIVVQQSGAYPMAIQQPYQQPMQPPGYQPMQAQQAPGYPQSNQPVQPQPQSSHIPPPPAYEEPAKPSDGQLYA
ncbi:hypothetical protein Bbelb_060110 [Branchiostoma belcheri]|nr:hypothetical protein Bbelb_060110 [Branchiostoma belcheri]